MPTRSPLRPILCGAPALATLILVACGGRSPLDTDIEAYDAPHAGHLPGAGGGVDSGAEDAGATPIEPIDAGQGTRDAGTGLPGLPGIGADAGGFAACFGCAESSCGMQVNACIASSACFSEGTCDLGCLGGAGGGAGGLGGLDPQCLQACTKDPQANQDLLAALTCTFESCSSPCLSALGGGAAGLGGLGALLGAPQ